MANGLWEFNIMATLYIGENFGGRDPILRGEVNRLCEVARLLAQTKPGARQIPISKGDMSLGERRYAHWEGLHAGSDLTGWSISVVEDCPEVTPLMLQAFEVGDWSTLPYWGRNFLEKKEQGF